MPHTLFPDGVDAAPPATSGLNEALADHLIVYAEHLIRMGEHDQARAVIAEAHAAQVRATAQRLEAARLDLT